MEKNNSLFKTVGKLIRIDKKVVLLQFKGCFVRDGISSEKQSASVTLLQKFFKTKSYVVHKFKTHRISGGPCQDHQPE